MKHAYLFIAGIFMCLSCSQAEQEEKEIGPDGQKQLTSVRVNMDFSYSQSPLDEENNSTRSTATDAGVNRIAFTVYDQENAVVYETTQLNTDTDFGTITKELHVGKYKFVAVAIIASSTEIECPSITSLTTAALPERPRNKVFSATQDVTIVGNTTQDVTMNMGNQRTAYFQLTTTDVVPDGVTKMNVEIRTGKTAQSTFSINPGTGTDLNAGSFIASANVEAGKVVDMATFLLLSSNEEAIDIKITAQDKDGKVLYSREKEDVPFQQAYLTKATGTFFSATATTTFNFETSLSGTKEIDL